MGMDYVSSEFVKGMIDLIENISFYLKYCKSRVSDKN